MYTGWLLWTLVFTVRCNKPCDTKEGRHNKLLTSLSKPSSEASILNVQLGVPVAVTVDPKRVGQPANRFAKQLLHTITP